MSQSDQNTADLPDFYNDLGKAFKAAWDLLECAAGDRRSAAHTPVLATTGSDGGVDARTVVLRHACRKQNSIRFHTDRRSGKITQIEKDPRCSILAYDPEEKMQLRLHGRAGLHLDDDIADLAWSGSRSSSLACYAQPIGGGAILADPQDAAVGSAPDLQFARENFCAVIIALERIEWVYLHHAGHRRARWQRGGQGWTGAWLAP